MPSINTPIKAPTKRAATLKMNRISSLFDSIQDSAEIVRRAYRIASTTRPPDLNLLAVALIAQEALEFMETTAWNFESNLEINSAAYQIKEIVEASFHGGECSIRVNFIASYVNDREETIEEHGTEFVSKYLDKSQISELRRVWETHQPKCLNRNNSLYKLTSVKSAAYLMDANDFPVFGLKQLS
jgi:hypothetical protein